MSLVDQKEGQDTGMSSGIHLGLGRIATLLKHVGNPHLATPIIHVAGTNGKGSVCAYLESILRTSGCRVGRFTSPHLVEVRDSITLNGKIIDSLAYNQAKQAVEEVNETRRVDASPFEVLTATAFLAFRQEIPPLDVAVIEVGMGGLTDATNVCPKPLVTVITPIDLDHQAFLGNTVKEIAKVKAGIIKTGVPCILSDQKSEEAAEAVKSVARDIGAPLLSPVPAQWVSPSVARLQVEEDAFDVTLPLSGNYQLSNVATAVAALKAFSANPNALWAKKISPHSIKAGIEQTRWPGRLEWITYGNHRLLLDGAHNPASIEELCAHLATLDEQPTTFICSVSSPRDPRMLLGPLLQNRKAAPKVIAIPFSTPDGMPWVKSIPTETLMRTAKELGSEASKATSILDALEQIDGDGVVVVCGSLYLISDVYRDLQVSR